MQQVDVVEDAGVVDKLPCNSRSIMSKVTLVGFINMLLPFFLDLVANFLLLHRKINKHLKCSNFSFSWCYCLLQIGDHDDMLNIRKIYTRNGWDENGMLLLAHVFSCEFCNKILKLHLIIWNRTELTLEKQIFLARFSWMTRAGETQVTFQNYNLQLDRCA